MPDGSTDDAKVAIDAAEKAQPEWEKSLPYREVNILELLRAVSEKEKLN